jgi:magnesium transporter
MAETTSSRPSPSERDLPARASDEEEPRRDDVVDASTLPPVWIVAERDGTVVETTDDSRLEELVGDLEARVWIDLHSPGPELMGRVGKLLGLHPLVAQNILEAQARAKVETFDDDEVVHVVLFAIAFRGEADATEVDFVLGRRFLLTAHGPGWHALDAPGLRMGVGAVLKYGTDKLLYVLADDIVDGYFPVLDKLGDEIDELQDRVVENADRWSLQRLFVLKRELITLRRAISPSREIFNQVTNRELGPIAPEHIVYFRDVYDHLIRVTDELDNYRELVAGTLEVYLSTVNNNLSLIMKRLTGVTVILAGIGAVAGVFGMSEAASALSGGERSGFWVISALIALGAFVTWIILRRIDWI